MPVITLPDGKARNFDHPVTVQQIAEDIGAGLAKATVAGVLQRGRNKLLVQEKKATTV